MLVITRIDVVGAGIFGLWQAFFIRRQGHSVTLWDSAGIPGGQAASRLAGAMLAPFCEGEPGHEVAHALGLESIPLWQELYPGFVKTGTLVVAAARDYAELRRFAAQTSGHKLADAVEIATLEPALEGRFREGLFFEGEGHIEPATAMEFLAAEAARLGIELHANAHDGNSADWIVDCRGLGARPDLKTLRGVRGERIIVECPEVTLHRPVRLLHPRIPFYIVPWSGHRFMIGATLIESEDSGPPSLRSAAELMSCAYALIPALGEARILDIAAGVRPSFPDNTPKIIVRDRRIAVNGSYRHGFLAAPILAKLTADYIEKGAMREGVVFADHGEW
jgi:glycine oxidase